MIYRVENLGPLREAEVDLSKRLLVLTGPNSSGKTYLAWSLYGLLRSRPRADARIFEELTEQLLASPTYELFLDDAVSKRLPELLAGLTKPYIEMLPLCFAAEREAFKGAIVSLVSHENITSILTPTGIIQSVSLLTRDDLRLSLRIHGQPSLLKFNILKISSRLEDVGSSLESSSAKLEPLSDAAVQEHLLGANGEERQEISNRVRFTIALHFWHRFVQRPCTLFSTERVAVNLFAKELALKRTELVDDLLDADLNVAQGDPRDMVRRRAQRYPWPIRDSLQVANDLERLSKDSREFDDLAGELERELLQGRIGLSPYGEFLFTPDAAPERQISIHLTASVVKSLADLVFYFRYRARKGDFIIIDEPELDLHPDNQRRIARLLAKAVNRGFQIMVSTHSDYIIGELNNMIMLSKVAEEDARKLGFDPAAALTPEKVGVYLFDQGTATPVAVEETGFSVKTIDDATRALNADTQRLYGHLFDER